ncbi:MAG: dehydrogenase [Prevotella sp.]|nr:dehydrogenase [Prevotella sp.]
MADNYLERRRESYEERKEAWLRKRRGLPLTGKRPERPEDEAL